MTPVAPADVEGEARGPDQGHRQDQPLPLRIPLAHEEEDGGHDDHAQRIEGIADARIVDGQADQPQRHPEGDHGPERDEGKRDNIGGHRGSSEDPTRNSSTARAA